MTVKWIKCMKTYANAQLAGKGTGSRTEKDKKTGEQKLKDWRSVREWLFDMDDRTVMIASHRGKFSSSVIENTSLAFLTALGEQADFMELDLDCTKDGVLIGHHDKTLLRLLHVDRPVSDFTWDEIREMPLYNYVGEINVTGLEPFPAILETMRGRAMVVLDKCWSHWDRVYEILEETGMTEQAAFKFYIKDEDAWNWAASHPDCMFIPMVGQTELLGRIAELAERTMVPSVEILPRRPEDGIFAEETFGWLHEHHMKIWCNSLSLARRLVYGAGYDDLRALEHGGEEGWGVLAERGVDILQTDWPYEVHTFLKEIGRRAER